MKRSARDFTTADPLGVVAAACNNLSGYTQVKPLRPDLDDR